MRVSYPVALVLLLAVEYVYSQSSTNITALALPDLENEEQDVKQIETDGDSEEETQNGASRTSQNANEGGPQSESAGSQDGEKEKSQDSTSTGSQDGEKEKSQDSTSTGSQNGAQGDSQDKTPGGKSQDSASGGSQNGNQEIAASEGSPNVVQGQSQSETDDGTVGNENQKNGNCEKSKNCVQEGGERGTSENVDLQNGAEGMSETGEPQGKSLEGSESRVIDQSKSGVLEESENGSEKVNQQQASRGTRRYWRWMCYGMSRVTMPRRAQYDSPAEYQRALYSGAQRGLQPESQGGLIWPQAPQLNCGRCSMQKFCRGIQQGMREDLRREFQRRLTEPCPTCTRERGTQSENQGEKQSRSSDTVDAQ